MGQINWQEAEQKWDAFVEENNNEQSTQAEFEEFQEIVDDSTLNWDKIEERYYDFLEESNNEAGPTERFEQLQEFIL